jgi:predicted phosphate transport protein (TIGR00153 family)
MWRLIPREMAFFDDVERLSAHVQQAAALLRDLVSDFSDVAAAARAIKDVEHAGDDVTHEVIARLHRAFRPPFDRQDIHALVTRLDDVLDQIDAVASAFEVYHVREPTPECRALTEAAVDCVGVMHEAVKCLRTFDPAFARHAEAVHGCEHRSDQLLRRDLGSLFHEDRDPVEILKWRDIYGMLESVTDRCEDVINTIKTIAVKEGRWRPDVGISPA